MAEVACKIAATTTRSYVSTPLSIDCQFDVALRVAILGPVALR